MYRMNRQMSIEDFVFPYARNVPAKNCGRAFGSSCNTFSEISDFSWRLFVRIG